MEKELEAICLGIGHNTQKKNMTSRNINWHWFWKQEQINQNRGEGLKMCVFHLISWNNHLAGYTVQ